MKSIELFYKETCPYCQKVLKHLRELGKTIKLRDTRSHPAVVDELITKGGKKQVPCLMIDDSPLYESDAIIVWIEEHAAQLEDLPVNDRM
ncbi:MAG: glutathione S-transferase N-terminal domain-containing protein [Simkaniaceae bacterium]|nr:glutathione S-transferase N-terminal domain-containing protein [Simkaniaceae bacterium]